jgi:hypothetical protein
VGYELAKILFPLNNALLMQGDGKALQSKSRGTW